MERQKKKSQQRTDELPGLRHRFRALERDVNPGTPVATTLELSGEPNFSCLGRAEALSFAVACGGLGEGTSQSAHESLQSVLNALPVRIFWKDRGSIYLGCNRAFALDAGLQTPADILGKSDHEMIWADQAELYQSEDRRVLMSGEPQVGRETPRVAVDGRTIWLRRNKVPLLNGDGRITGVLGTYEDITERKKTEEEFLRTEKLESLRVLAGGLAHDFNNLMTVILGSLSLALMDPNLRDKTFRVLKEAEKACLGSMRLTERLISTASDDARFKKTEPIPEILEGAVDRGLAGSPVRCEMFADKDLWPVHCDAKQAHRALTNVIVNAKEAVHHDGIIRVAASNIQLREGELPPLKGGKYVRVTVEDSGIGISEEHLPLIFDPYFSTKERGNKKGMGLGLTITYAILKRHEGHVRVESKAGAGSSVHMYLPAGVNS